MNFKVDKKKKKTKFTEVVDNGVETEENPSSISNFRISDPLREALKVKGIEYLFPIQATTFDIILDGSDLVGRARTGQVYIIYDASNSHTHLPLHLKQFFFLNIFG